MTSKFEQLIEYVINDEEDKAKALFHDIVVEKSREIYETLMNEEEECEHCHAHPCECDEDIEEGMDNTSGDASQDLMREVETEEEGMYEEEEEEEDVEFDDKAEEAGEDETHDLEHDHDEGNKIEHDIEDRVVDLEDKLDELMAEFESLMGSEGEHHSEMEPNSDDVGGDAYMDDDTSEFHDESQPMSENIALDKVAPVKHGDNGANPKSPTRFNSGAAGMQGRPVKNVASEADPDGTTAYRAPTSYADKGRGDLPGAGKFKNVPAKDGYGAKMEPTPKPVTAQASGVNTRTPFPKA
jgi:hypothetical protein